MMFADDFFFATGRGESSSSSASRAAAGASSLLSNACDPVTGSGAGASTLGLGLTAARTASARALLGGALRRAGGGALQRTDPLFSQFLSLRSRGLAHRRRTVAPASA